MSLVRRLSFPTWAAILAAWNLFVWGGRLRNLIVDPGGLAVANRWSLLASVGFSLMALVVLGFWLARWRGQGVGSGLGHPVALLMAFVGIGLWLVRGLAIASADYSIGFIIVHSVLALITIALGLAVLASGLSWTRRPSRIAS